MRILALDLGKSNSVACVFEGVGAAARYRKVASVPQAVHDLIVAEQPERVVFEIGPQAGWLHDLVAGLGIEVQVANPNHEGWRWRNVKRKTDRLDALKLAKLSSMDQVPLVHVPQAAVGDPDGPGPGGAGGGASCAGTDFRAGLRGPRLRVSTGAVLSPLLLNIYLDGLDHAMAQAGYEMVRYAGDFVVLCRSEAEALAALERVRQWTERAGLRLYPDKTRVVDTTRKGGFDFRNRSQLCGQE